MPRRSGEGLNRCATVAIAAALLREEPVFQATSAATDRAPVAPRARPDRSRQRSPRHGRRSHCADRSTPTAPRRGLQAVHPTYCDTRCGRDRGHDTSIALHTDRFGGPTVPCQPWTPIDETRLDSRAIRRSSPARPPGVIAVDARECADRSFESSRYASSSSYRSVSAWHARGDARARDHIGGSVGRRRPDRTERFAARRHP